MTSRYKDNYSKIWGLKWAEMAIECNQTIAISEVMRFSHRDCIEGKERKFNLEK
jgi:hypothetical protein